MRLARACVVAFVIALLQVRGTLPAAAEDFALPGDQAPAAADYEGALVPYGDWLDGGQYGRARRP